MSEPAKLYELAKDLGVNSIDLVNLCKNELGIQVRSHMSEVTGEQVDAIRKHYKKPGKEETKKAVVRRKKAAEPTEVAAEEPKKTTTRTKKEAVPVRKKVILRKSGQEDEVESAPVKEEKSEPMSMERKLSEEIKAFEENKKAEEQELRQQVKEEKEEPVQTKKVEEVEVKKDPSEEPSRQRTGILKIVKGAPQPQPKKPTPAVEIKKPAQAGEVKLTLAEEEELRKEKGLKGPLGKNLKKTGIREIDKEALFKLEDYTKHIVTTFTPKKRKALPNRELRKTQITKKSTEKRIVPFNGSITVGGLAQGLGAKAGLIIQKLMAMGSTANINSVLDFDTASLIANEFEYELKDVSFKEEEKIATEKVADANSVERPPIVTIMGHVDHGKTTLLDAIRQANVVATEHGGITQHIGAYQVSKKGKLITFIDTPGHEAFSEMRARGAKVTDIVVLVVAADDGVMPQTREAVDHAKAAGVPIIVAVNKMDKPGANPDRVKNGLAELSLLPEDWGGETIYVPVSAIKKEGLDELLEQILLTAEVAELKANPNAPAIGTVVESKLDKGKGPLATVIIQQGTLRVGDYLAIGKFGGKVRALIDFNGKPIKEAGPSTPAEVLGLSEVPAAGLTFNVCKSERDMKELIDHRLEEERKKTQTLARTSLEDLLKMTQELKKLNVIIKADVTGSAEAIKAKVEQIKVPETEIKILRVGVGPVNESDVLLAASSGALILSFNVRPDTAAKRLADERRVEIQTYQIIYELLDNLEKILKGLLEPIEVEVYLGRAEVRQTFSVPKFGIIAGCAVVDGKINRSATVRVLREGRIVYTGKLGSLKRFKDDVKEVAQGYECGMNIENYNDVKIGDIFEAFNVEKQARA